MNLTLLKAKIHRATVTKADLHYQGSITVDKKLLKASGILPYEQVDVLNITNGARFTTYAIEGKDGEIQINGAAAHLAKKGHMVIIVAYCQLSEKEVKQHKAKIIFVDKKNKVIKYTKK